jgi:hypothetical protein
MSGDAKTTDLRDAELLGEVALAIMVDAAVGSVLIEKTAADVITLVRRHDAEVRNV